MSFWSRQSIAVKLPLAFAFVLLILGTAMGVVSYLEVRQTVVNIASQRLEQAASQMATMLGVSGRQRIAAMQQLMQRADIIEFLRTRDAAHAASIEASILKYLGAASAIADVEVWDPSGRRLLSAGAQFDAADDPSHAGYIKELASAAIIGRLRLVGDGLLYPVGGRVEQNGETLGYVIERRRISNPAQTQQTISLLSGLIGSAATIVVGNSDGSAWTDLSKVGVGRADYAGRERSAARV